MKKNYPQTVSNPHFPLLEQKLLSYWKERGIFKKSIEQRNKSSQFVFYDGPPFANGLPHYGHLLTGYVKDTYARFQTTLGKRVERRFGWDCHGLPAEMQAEKELGLSGSLSIKNYGIENFNSHCRSSVLKYVSAWKSYVERQGRWVDFENDYKTMNRKFMESVLWSFKELYKKGYIYHDVKVVPYSWACQTPLSNFETRLDNSYRERADKAATVLFELASIPESLAERGIKSCFVAAWTTTPWTLPANLALAVGAKLQYAAMVLEGKCYLISKASLAKYKQELSNFKHELTLAGEQLVGLRYKPLFDYFAENSNSFYVLEANFVGSEEGTGIVHIAPAFGEDDHALCKDHSIPLVCPIDEGAKFTHQVPEFEGIQVFDANELITRKLKSEGKLLKLEQYIHSYPHCWRTDTPLIYKAIPSWYVRASALRDKMVELNKKINWVPNYVRDNLFGKWLENAKDWAISRHRFWGTPIPVWISDNTEFPRIEVYGSVAELEEAFGKKVEDLHRPYIDSLVRPNPDDPSGKSLMKRVGDVFDCWFESGSMPYAQLHYPFENKEEFENNFPADFIVEYTAQTRGWFYTLLVLATALFDKPPFLNCICHGTVLDERGQKLSKRFQNYPDPNELFAQYGSDALRIAMLSSNVTLGGELLIDRDGKLVYDALRLSLKPIWQAYHFFCLYANADGVEAKCRYEYENPLDRYAIALLGSAVEQIKQNLESFNTQGAYRSLDSFFENLNNWYIRRSRERFWKSEVCSDKLSAYDALFTCLVNIAKAGSALVPFAFEEIYLGLCSNKESVHLEDFPNISTSTEDQKLLELMSKARAICGAALFIRSKHKIKIRQPLQTLTIATLDDTELEPFAEFIKEEINVKEVVFTKALSEFTTKELALEVPQVAKRIPHKASALIKEVRAGNWRAHQNKVFVGEEELCKNEYSILIREKEGIEAVKAISEINCAVKLNIDISNELWSEGIARDLVRSIQEERKEAELEITDRIIIQITTDDEVIARTLLNWKSFIEEQTLSSLEAVKQIDANCKKVDIGESKVCFRICRMEQH